MVPEAVTGGLQADKKVKLTVRIVFFIFVTAQCYTYMPSLVFPMLGWYFWKYLKISCVSKLKVHPFKLHCEAIAFCKLPFCPPAPRRSSAVSQVCRVSFTDYWTSWCSVQWDTGTRDPSRCSSCFGSTALGHPKILADGVVVNVAWRGSEGKRNTFCIPSAVGKWRKSSIMGLKFHINDIL